MAAFPGLEHERYWAASPRTELAWAESPERIAYTVDFDPNSANDGQAMTYFRGYSYFVRAVRDASATADLGITADEADLAKGDSARHAAIWSSLPGLRQFDVRRLFSGAERLAEPSVPAASTIVRRPRCPPASDRSALGCERSGSQRSDDHADVSGGDRTVPTTDPPP